MVNIENLSARMESEGKKQEFFDIVIEGKFTPDELLFNEIPAGSSIKRTPESEAYLEQKWKELLASGFKPWPNDTKPSRYRLADAKVENGTLITTLDPAISYRDCVGGSTDEYREQFGEEASMRALASTVIVLAHNQAGEEGIMLTLRNSTQDYKPNGFHVSTGGWIDINKKETPLEAAYRELEEEAGISKNEVEDFFCRGIVNDPLRNQGDIIFQGTSSVPIEEIKKRCHDDENELLFIPTDRIKIQQWLLAPAHANTTIGLSAILLFGKDRFGEQWFNEMNAALAWRSQNYSNEENRKTLEIRDTERLQKKVTALKKQDTNNT
jgi:8-oxo-dGTP pyrophosphatase MutT (NUDIX family)